MNLSFFSSEYNDLRIFIFDIPFDKETREALRVEYTLVNCHQFNEKHIVAVCDTTRKRNAFIAMSKIKINDKEYNVSGWIKRDGTPMTRNEYQKNKDDQDRRNQQKNQGDTEFRRPIGRGRVLSTKVVNHDRLPNICQVNINTNKDSNNNTMHSAVYVNDYVKRVEHLCPDYFSYKDMAKITEKEKIGIAKHLINEYPELFRDYSEEELKICPYPDMTLQDEVMRMTDELLTRKCERERPKPKVALRMKFTEEEEEILGRNRPSIPPCYTEIKRPPPGTLVKPSELPCIISSIYLLEAKERLQKQLKALDEEDQHMLEQDKKKN